MFYLWTGSSSGFAPSMYQSLDYLLDAYPLSHGCHRQVRSRLLLRNIKGIRIDRERERDRFRYISKKPTCVAAPSPRASLGRRTVCGRTEQRRPPVLKRYETKVRMVWGSFLIAAAARKTPTRNCYNAQGVNLTFHPPPPPPPPPPPAAQMAATVMFGPDSAVHDSASSPDEKGVSPRDLIPMGARVHPRVHPNPRRGVTTSTANATSRQPPPPPPPKLPPLSPLPLPPLTTNTGGGPVGLGFLAGAGAGRGNTGGGGRDDTGGGQPAGWGYLPGWLRTAGARSIPEGGAWEDTGGDTGRRKDTGGGARAVGRADTRGGGAWGRGVSIAGGERRVGWWGGPAAVPPAVSIARRGATRAQEQVRTRKRF